MPYGLRDQESRAPARSRDVGSIGLWVICLLAVAGRLWLYGDLRLAIATADLNSYIRSSRAPVFSWADFSGRRLFTTNLVFRSISQGSNCGEAPISSPATGEEGQRGIQPCVATIAVAQALLSIVGWAWLAFAISRQLSATAARLLGAATILLFGFTPQLAAWDSILSSESLTLSLFALSLGCLVELAFLWPSEVSRRSAYTLLLCALWLISFALWVFTRDANLYAIPVTLVLLVPLAGSKTPRRRRWLVTVAIILTGLLVLGLLSSRQSTRWQPSIQHSLETFIFPYPAREEFLSERFGMPRPSSPEYAPWFESQAPTAFAGFLAFHPGFIAQTILENWSIFTQNYQQPYFRLENADAEAALLQFGEVLHPSSGAFYLLDALILIAISIAALTGRDIRRSTWAWILGWLYLTAAATLVLSFIGDTCGVQRHIFPSLEMLRLLMWMSLFVLMDGCLSSYGATTPVSDAFGAAPPPPSNDAQEGRAAGATQASTKGSAR